MILVLAGSRSGASHQNLKYVHGQSSATAWPLKPGNLNPHHPRARILHLTEGSALINRYGFPSQGHAPVLLRLRVRIQKFFSQEDKSSMVLQSGSPTSINDFVSGGGTFGLYSDVLVVNVSSLNMPGLW